MNDEKDMGVLFEVVDNRTPPALFIENEQLQVLISEKVSSLAKTVYLQLYFVHTFKVVTGDLLEYLAQRNREAKNKLREALHDLAAFDLIHLTIVDGKYYVKLIDQTESPSTRI